MNHTWTGIRGTGVKWCSKCGTLWDSIAIDAYCAPGNDGDTQEAMPPCLNLAHQRNLLAGVLAGWQGSFASYGTPELEALAKEHGQMGMGATIELINRDEE